MTKPHERTLTLPIASGDKTCYVDMVPCRFVGTRRMGTMWVCRLFPTEQASYTELEDSNQDGTGSLLRCSDCLAAEECGK